MAFTYRFFRDQECNNPISSLLSESGTFRHPDWGPVDSLTFCMDEGNETKIFMDGLYLSQGITAPLYVKVSRARNVEGDWEFGAFNISSQPFTGSLTCSDGTVTSSAVDGSVWNYAYYTPASANDYIVYKITPSFASGPIGSTSMELTIAYQPRITTPAPTTGFTYQFFRDSECNNQITSIISTGMSRSFIVPTWGPGLVSASCMEDNDVTRIFMSDLVLFPGSYDSLYVKVSRARSAAGNWAFESFSITAHSDDSLVGSLTCLDRGISSISVNETPGLIATYSPTLTDDYIVYKITPSVSSGRMNFMTLELGYEQYTPPNTAPTNINLSASSIQENNAVGAVIGTFSTTDAEAGAMAYSLVTGTGDTDNASFKIDGASLKADYAFDFEAKSSYNIRVRSTDSGGLFFEKEFTISVTNVSEAAVLPTSGTTAPVLVGTKVVGKLTVDPRTNGVTYNGQSLPKGSILRNTADGKKFLKVTGDSKAFTAIEVTPKAEWNYSTGADAAWEVLQDA